MPLGFLKKKILFKYYLRKFLKFLHRVLPSLSKMGPLVPLPLPDVTNIRFFA